MSKSYTNRSEVVYHEDGSWTEYSEITRQPATRAEKVTAYSLLGALCVAPFAPLVALIAVDRYEARKEARKAKKAAKKSESK